MTEYFNLMVHMKWSRLLLACRFCHVIVSPKTLVFLFLYFLSICCVFFLFPMYFIHLLFIFYLFPLCFLCFSVHLPSQGHRTYVICLIFCIGVAALCWPWERMPIMTGFCSWRQGVWFFWYPKLHFTFVVQLFWSHAATRCGERDT